MRILSISSTRLEAMNERLQFFPQTIGSIFDTQPPSAADPVFQPVLELCRHPHHVDIDAAKAVALGVLIAADRFARDDAEEARFLFGLADRRLTRTFPSVDGSFGKDPALAGRGRDQRHL